MWLISWYDLDLISGIENVDFMKSESRFNSGIFGQVDFLLKLQNFPNGPNVVSAAEPHNGYFYYNTNSLQEWGHSILEGVKAEILMQF